MQLVPTVINTGGSCSEQHHRRHARRQGCSSPTSSCPTAQGPTRARMNPAVSPTHRKKTTNGGSPTPTSYFSAISCRPLPPYVKRSEMLHSGRFRSGSVWRHGPVMPCYHFLHLFCFLSLPDVP